MSTATNLTTTRPFLLALSGTHPGTPALPNEPVTKARTHFRSHPLHKRSQLDAARVTLKVTAKMYVDATASEPASITSTTAAVLLAVSVRGWDRVVVFRGQYFEPGTALSTNSTKRTSTVLYDVSE